MTSSSKLREFSSTDALGSFFSLEPPDALPLDPDDALPFNLSLRRALTCEYRTHSEYE
jgi:hypothetical protein